MVESKSGFKVGRTGGVPLEEGSVVVGNRGALCQGAFSMSRASVPVVLLCGAARATEDDAVVPSRARVAAR